MNKELIINNDPKSPISEVFRSLRTNMQYLNNDSGKQTIVTTSTVQGEGKTWITCNLAVAFAQLGKKTLLIDSDMRVPRVHRIFEMDQYPGLSNYLSKISQTGRNEEYSIDSVIKYTEIKNLALILAGSIPPNPSELLSSNRLEQLIEDAKEKFDVIIFDGTPCLLVTDAIIISRLVDSTLVVTSNRKTKLDDLKEVKKRVENAGGHIVGVVLNRVKESSKKYESKYYYSYDKSDRKHHSSNYGRHAKDEIFNEREDIRTALASEFGNEEKRIDSLEEKISQNINETKNNRFEDIIQNENLIDVEDIEDNNESEGGKRFSEEPRIIDFAEKKEEPEIAVKEESAEEILEDKAINDTSTLNEETLKTEEFITKDENIESDIKKAEEPEVIKKETKKDTKRKKDTEKEKAKKVLKDKKEKEKKTVKETKETKKLSTAKKIPAKTKGIVKTTKAKASTTSAKNTEKKEPASKKTSTKKTTKVDAEEVKVRNTLKEKILDLFTEEVDEEESK